MKVEEIVDKFVKSPSQLTTGMPSLAKRWGVNLDDLYLAKGIANDIVKNKEKFGTEYNPEDVAFTKANISHYENLTQEDVKNGIIDLYNNKYKQEGKLKSKWGSEGNWKYSYDYTQKSCENIDFEGILSKVFSSQEKVAEISYNEPIQTGKHNMSIYLSDQHIGMSVDHALYQNYFDKHVYRDRMNKVSTNIGTKSNLYGGFDTIIINFLGDTFDGQDGFTVKRTHDLPQNMSNEECFEVGLMTNKVFLERLFKSGWANNYKVYFVRESNHGGDMDLYLFKALKMWMNTAFPQVEVVIARRFIDHYTIGDHTFIYTHGKDNRDMKNGLPLNLDPKTEIFINQYIYENNIKGCISFISGDLHQDSTNNAKLFRYRKVPSIAGSSKWIMSNYGLTQPGVGYDIFQPDKKEILSGVINL